MCSTDFSIQMSNNFANLDPKLHKNDFVIWFEIHTIYCKL